MAGRLFFAFTPAERVALDAVRDEHPKTVAALRGRLVPVVGELSRTCRGRVVIELETEDLLDRLRDEFASRMMTEMAPWGEDEDLREPREDQSEPRSMIMDALL